MRVTICDDKKDLGTQSGKLGGDAIIKAIEANGIAYIVLESGASQIPTLAYLASRDDIDWSKVEVFQFDEFQELKDTSKSNSNFLQNYFIHLLKQKPKAFHSLSSTTCDLKEINKVLDGITFDVAFACIGENGHLGYNDPPANISTKEPYIAVELEIRSRKQLLNEGWFSHLEDIPTKAVTLSIIKLLESRIVVVSCPDQRKARGVATCLFGQISPLQPCTLLRRKHECSLFLDLPSSMLVYGDLRTRY